ncbi:MAG TPA: cyclase [Clostridiales bacterium UBA8960]|jgi:arylformamidase|nr:cyclase [Clostridiales bacterium UBA8960]
METGECVMKDWIDVTMAISPSIMVYKNKEEKMPKFIVRATHDKDGHHESSICMDLHTGTHIDMPKHMLKEGHSSDAFNLESVNGRCVVVDFSKSYKHEVDDEFLKFYKFEKNDIVIIKTKNSFDKTFNYEYDFLNASGAEFLKNQGVKAVGIDALGIERNVPGHPTHRILLGNGIYIIEGLALAEIEEGIYEFMCIPLKIADVEGLPARAFLRSIKDV